MRAAVVAGPNQTPVYRDFAAPTPRDGFTIVDVAASALSNATRARAAGSHYSAMGSFPLVPGIDGVGRTEDGRRVGFILPEAPYGGMAEKTLVRDDLCLPIPDGLGSVRAAAVINPGAAAVGALRMRAGLRSGESVLINGGTGTTGQTAVQIAKHLGAGRVVATGRNAEALAKLVELGADHTVDLSAEPDTVRTELAGQTEEVDIVLDYLSGPPTEAVLAAIARSHHKVGTPLRYVITGTAAGSATTVPTSALASTPLVLMGSGIGGLSLPELVQAAEDVLQIATTIDLHIDITERPLADVADAWPTTDDRNRIVFTI